MSRRFPPIDDPVAFTEALETLFRRAEAHPDPAVHDLVLDVSEAVMHLHHDALFRIVMLLRNAPEGARVLEVLRGDPVVGVLLAEHGLLDGPAQAPEARVRAALDRVRPYMHGHGGDVEVLDVRDGVARLRLQGACHGCGSSLLTLKMGIEQVLRDAVPDLRGIEVEGLPAVRAGEAFVPLEAVEKARRWNDLGPVQQFSYGVQHLLLHGTAVVLATAFGRIYAVRDRCPRGGGSLQGATLEAFVLVCPCHGERYDLRSGRSLSDPTLVLEHVPVVIEQGQVQVAVG
ncbi:MAG: NifU family protein [Armatimonadota bacterium]|nr:NifU family protein [Armatimonadota bacterium]MDR7486740.1 NifU family protein [Armatimonadota bacterium]MDR7534280.1 NifU family protein [Armatimonadota bacterium]MDR7535369.1 NifU family protein [Armatimonadota bacterium]